MTSAQHGLIPSCKHPAVPGDPPGAAGFQSGHHWGPPWASTESPVMVTGGPRQGSVGRTLSASSEPIAKRTGPMDLLSRGLSVPLIVPLAPPSVPPRAGSVGIKMMAAATAGDRSLLASEHRTELGSSERVGDTLKVTQGSNSWGLALLPGRRVPSLPAGRPTPLCSD